MTVAIGNYSVKYREYAEMNIRPNLPTGDLGAFDFFTESLNRAVHFHLPDWGDLLARSARGPSVYGQELMPPFPELVIEFAAPGSDSSKRLMLVTTAIDVGVPSVVLLPVEYSDSKRLWTPPYVGFAFPLDGTHSGRTLTSCGTSGPGFFTHPFLAHSAQKLFWEGEPWEGLIDEFHDEIMAYLDMVQALSCKNVGTIDVPAPASLNASRVKRGEPRLFDYKVLTVGPANASRSRSDAPEGEGASRRAHLRRGHIRRLQSGRRIWVNAAFISGHGGFVHKSYSVLGQGAQSTKEQTNAR